jgi:hypothetical protein
MSMVTFLLPKLQEIKNSGTYSMIPCGCNQQINIVQKKNLVSSTKVFQR